MNPNRRNAYTSQAGSEAAPAERDSVPAPLLSMPAAAASTSPNAARRWLVLGVFPSAIRASAAAASLTAAGGQAFDVLLLSSAASNPETEGSDAFDTRVTIHHVDVSGSLSATRALSRSDLLSSFWDQIIRASVHGKDASSPRVQDLFARLVHHLESGAAILIVRAADPERQLLVSRTLLASKCEVLLTHEVAQAESCATPEANDEDSCCRNCTEKSCGRFDPA